MPDCVACSAQSLHRVTTLKPVMCAQVTLCFLQSIETWQYDLHSCKATVIVFEMQAPRGAKIGKLCSVGSAEGCRGEGTHCAVHKSPSGHEISGISFYLYWRTFYKHWLHVGSALHLGLAVLSILGFGQLCYLWQSFHSWKDLMDSVKSCSQVCKATMLCNHVMQQRLYGLRQRLCPLQVLVGLFGVSLRTLGMSPGCHGAVPLQQPTLNLIGYCTGKPPCCPCCIPFVMSWQHGELPAALQSGQKCS